ncbi:MAG: threonylcarbamoyl-AMP synthase [Lachnospiraceae bacterium]|nr:threonylcarbamoyl-AMP synthase [Lachnospiraceae bacterium]
MNTIVVTVDKENPDIKVLAQAGDIIKSGGLVAFPTETVYGLGGDALNAQSSHKIYAAKGRPSDNPLIVHICDIKDLDAIVEEIPEFAKRLAEAFWPGPLTMIFRKSEKVPYETTGGLDTVAVRMPEHKTALEFIRQAGGYVAAPSANVSGRPSPTIADHVIEDLSGRVEMILDGGEVGIGLESTIVDLTEHVPMILRPGYITAEMLKTVIGEVTIDQAILHADSKEAPKAPGMKYRHYAPKGSLSIVEGNMEQVTTRIQHLLIEAKQAGRKVGVIGTDETVSLYADADVIKSLGSRTDEEAIARHLYKVLREFDEEEVTQIYSESFGDNKMGQAIMNRLLKAAGHQIIQA